MQRNKAGIPVNVPRGFRKTHDKREIVAKVTDVQVLESEEVITYAVLEKVENGLLRVEIGPMNTKEFEQALNDGFEIESTFRKKPVKFKNKQIGA